MIKGMLTKLIAYEIGFNKMFYSSNIGIDFQCYYRYEGDHKGFFFNVYLLTYGFEFNIYDIRHDEDICGSV